jgi:hypothetical protein
MQKMDADSLDSCGYIEDDPARSEAPGFEDEGQDVAEDDVCARNCQVCLLAERQ